jgi:hypothetical protein
MQIGADEIGAISNGRGSILWFATNDGVIVLPNRGGWGIAASELIAGAPA